jgi:thiamine pyrophosphate-dependent acetolactate synthase large subunit-like protein
VTLRGADILARGLARGGARCVFTLSGNHIVPVFDAAIDAHLRIVHVRHEGAATHMADAWGRLTREPGIALFTGGPGHANGVGPLLTALAAESPLVMLSGHAPLDQVGLDGFQELRQADMAAPAVKASWTAKSAAALGEEIARAMQMARSGRPGPVHLSIPSDLFEAPVEGADGAIPTAEAFRAVPAPLAEPTAEAVIAELARAKRPLVLTGPTMANDRGRELRVSLAEVTGIPVLFMESPRGIADPSLGAVADVLAQADLVVLLGKKLDFTLKFGRPPTFDAACRFVQIDPDPEAIGRAARALGAASRIVVTAVADTLPAAECLVRVGARRAPRRDGWAEDVQSAIRYRPAEWTALATREGAVHPVAVGRAIRDYFAREPGAVYVSDGGEYSQWVQASVDASTRITNGPGGAIGGGVPFAIAASLARPDARVVLSTGDGSFGYHLAEYETAGRERAPFVAVVGNDGCWNAEYQIQLRTYGRDRAIGCEMSLAVRYDLVVSALGGYGELVTKGPDLAVALERAVQSGRPACLNVMVERVAAPAISRRAAAPTTSSG